ncbi:glycosyltransferase [Thiomicrorhabdus sp. ZW0627]|uniref:glycosyltransferase n=1 Tax=Thiomicrorhabdus sp. ZW0627 TaxID=3039774 RepID=UPI002436CCB5|nr:glycosyltransferase [Thiomicrorhabdus sp. ZW0627]MDG6773620.1 glycosyltransferase [Thiomicrorhabdus sp. ZW0627]
MYQPKVSVCIPVYNGENHLQETVESVLNQSYRNIEVLIQDNASSDGTGIILNDLCDLDERVMVERNDSLVSMAANWNLVVKRASGDYLVLLSADDLIESNFIEECISVFRDEPNVNIVSTEHLLLTQKGLRKRKMRVHGGKRLMSCSEILLKNPFSINFTMFDRSFIKNNLMSRGVLFREPYFTCDYDLWIRLALNNSVIFFIDKPLAKYRVHEGSLSSNALRMIKHTLLVLSANKEALSERCSPVYKLTLFRLFLRTVKLYVKIKCYDTRIWRLIFNRIIQ